MNTQTKLVARRHPLPKKATHRLRSKELMKELIRDRMSVRYVSAEVARQSGRNTLHPSFITHLMAGRKTQCSAEIAYALEEVLGVPPGILFEPIVSTKGKRTVSDLAA